MEEKLIQFVRESPFLYEKRHSCYKNIKMKQKTWEEIGKKLNLSVNEVSGRWKTLRDRFYRERRKIVPQVSGNAATSPKTKWKYFDLMLFLVESQQPNMNTSGNYEREIIEEVSASSFLQHYTPDLEVDEDGSLLFDETFETSSDGSNFSGAAVQPSASNYRNRSSSPKNSQASTSAKTLGGSEAPTTQRRRRTLSQSVLIENAHKEMTTFLKSAKQSLEGTSPVWAFLKGIAVQVESANLSTRNFQSLQLEIMNIVHNKISKQEEENRETANLNGTQRT